MFCNYSKASCNIPENAINLPSPLRCPCKTYLKTTEIDLTEGHVMTTNFKAIRNRRLQHEFECGAKFKHKLEFATIEEVIKCSLDEYINKLNQRNENVSADIRQNRQSWKDKVIQRCQQNLNNITNSIKRINRLDTTTLHHLKQLKKHFVISKADKLSHNLVLTCNPYYQYCLQKELTSPVYRPVNLTRDQILLNLNQFNLANNLKHVNSVPYLYAIPKLHKNPHSLRFIAKVHGQTNMNDQQLGESTILRIHKRQPIQPACATTYDVNEYFYM